MQVFDLRAPRWLLRKARSGFWSRPAAPVLHNGEQVVFGGKVVQVTDARKLVPYVKFTHDTSAEEPVVVNGIEVVAP